jgi:L-fucose isomerase-like protein
MYMLTVYYTLHHFVHIYRRTAAGSPKMTKSLSPRTLPSAVPVGSVDSSVKGTAVSSTTTDSVASCNAEITSTVDSTRNKDASAVDSTITASMTTASTAGTAIVTTEDATVAIASVAAVGSAERALKEASIVKDIKMSADAIIDEHREGILEGVYCVHTPLL